MKSRQLLVVAFALSLTGCGRQDTQPQIYQHFTDQLKARYPVLGWPCAHREVRDCYRFDPPAPMRGLWSTHFEESRFISATEPVPEDENAFATNKTWLEVLSSNLPKRVDSGDYEIEFVGRRTTVAGRYGQMGESKYLVVVDKLISIRPVNLEQWITHWVESSETAKSTRTPR